MQTGQTVRVEGLAGEYRITEAGLTDDASGETRVRVRSPAGREYVVPESDVRDAPCSWCGELATTQDGDGDPACEAHASWELP